MSGITVKRMDVAASVFFFALAVAVAIEGVRLGAGWDDRGPQSGFFPFWLAVLMAFGAVASFIQAIRRRGSQPFMENRQEVVDLLKVGVPLALTVIAIPWTGVYVATFLYVGLFAWWYGGFRWWSSLIAGVCFSGFLYLALARAMRISMPMSVFYEKGILPF
jgi:putative tricarboxylic transport membrane protein